MKKVFRATFIIPILVLAACGGNNNPAPVDAHDGPTNDGTGDKPSTDVPLEHAAETGPDGTGDVADGTSPDGTSPDAVDGATDAAEAAATDAADAGDVAATDGAGPDGGADAADAAAEVKPQKLVTTVLVVDQAPDGGSVDAAADAPQMPTVDPNLVNPWGLAFSPTGPLWVADNGTGLSTVYSSQGLIQALVVTIPAPTGGTSPSAPSGLVYNVTNAFQSDLFIFSSEGGTIAGWQSGGMAMTRAENASTHAVYKGLALGLRNNVPRLFATDFHNGKVDVYDETYNKITTTGGFADPNLPAGFAPFGIHAEGAAIYVTYAKQDTDAKDDVKGAGNGYVDVFDFDGVLGKRLISGGVLNSPWAVALAPADFGGLSHALLVGNFGDGRINAFDLTSGAYLSTAAGTTGAPLAIDGLWSLVFGNDTAGAAHNQLFFTAGPVDESHGILGRLDFVP
jgi:uncharacterized protein (TIGR03118 family)